MGYRLLVCDTVYIDDKPQGCGWFSCLWIDPEKRGKGVAKALVRESQEVWKGQTFSADPAPAANMLLKGMSQLIGPYERQGARAYLRFNTAFLLPAKKPKIKPFKPLLTLADTLLNVPQALRLRFAKVKSNLVPEKINRADSEVDHFIAPYLQGKLFRRGVTELNWITDYPWIKTGKPDYDSKRYFFSSVADRFEFQHWKLRDANGNMVAYLLVAVRNKNLKVPYAYFNEQHTAQVANFIISLMLAEKLDMLTTFHPLLAPYFLKNQSPFIWVKPMRKNYYAGKEMGDVLRTGTDPNFEDGDGDQAFT